LNILGIHNNANSGLHDYKAELDARIHSGEVFTFFRSLRTPWADNVLVAVTELGNSFVNNFHGLRRLADNMVKSASVIKHNPRQW
jgi:hypothetical protein